MVGKLAVSKWSADGHRVVGRFGSAYYMSKKMGNYFLDRQYNLRDPLRVFCRWSAVVMAWLYADLDGIDPCPALGGGQIRTSEITQDPPCFKIRIRIWHFSNNIILNSRVFN